MSPNNNFIILDFSTPFYRFLIDEFGEASKEFGCFSFYLALKGALIAIEEDYGLLFYLANIILILFYEPFLLDIIYRHNFWL
jgi:hypothetical protein